MKKLLFFLILPFVVSSCTIKSKSISGVLFDDALEWIDEVFLEKNKVDLSPTQSETPKKRTFIVSSDDSFSEIFKAGTEIAPNFQKERIVVYTFFCIYTQTYHLKNINYKDNIIDISCERSGRSIFSPATGSSCSPYQRWFIIKINTSNYIETANVEVIN